MLSAKHKMCLSYMDVLSANTAARARAKKNHEGGHVERSGYRAWGSWSYMEALSANTAAPREKKS